MLYPRLPGLVWGEWRYVQRVRRRPRPEAFCLKTSSYGSRPDLHRLRGSIKQRAAVAIAKNVLELNVLEPVLIIGSRQKSPNPFRLSLGKSGEAVATPSSNSTAARQHPNAYGLIPGGRITNIHPVAGAARALTELLHYHEYVGARKCSSEHDYRSTAVS